MSKSILLLRPHPFLADSLAQTLRDLGFASLKFTDASDFDRYAADVRQAAGAVVSLALASPVPQSAEEIIAELRRRQLQLPLVLTGLADIGALTKTAQSLLPAARFQTIESYPNARRDPATDVLIVRRDDLVQADRVTRLKSALERHYAGGLPHRAAA